MRFIKVERWFENPDKVGPAKERTRWICADHIRVIEEVPEGRPRCYLWGLYHDEALAVAHTAEDILNMISAAENR